MNWLLMMVVALTGCTVTVSPLAAPRKRVVTRHHHRHHHHVTPVAAQRIVPRVQPGPRTGTKLVDSNWMKEYLELEAHYGRIPADDHIRVNNGGFIINDEVSARYQALKKAKIEEKEP